MTVKELAGAVILFAGAITGGGAVVKWVDDRYIGAAEQARVDAQIYHLRGEMADLEGVKTLYDARLELDGELSPADRARRETVIDKLRAANDEMRRLENERKGLSN